MSSVRHRGWASPEKVKGRRGIFPGRLLEVGAEYPVQALVVNQVRIAVRRVDGVDADELGGEVPRHLFDVFDERPLGPPVAVAARTHDGVVGRARHEPGG